MGTVDTVENNNDSGHSGTNTPWDTAGHSGTHGHNWTQLDTVGNSGHRENNGKQDQP